MKTGIEIIEVFLSYEITGLRSNAAEILGGFHSWKSAVFN